MFGLFISLALLGLSAIDPIGIAAMPLLLLQKHPFRRSFIFLSGSFVSLMVMGLLFAEGFGQVVLSFERAHSWFIPSAEIAAGIVLLGVAGTIFWQLRHNKISVDPPDSIAKRLRLGNAQLFVVGALLVAVQSIVDVVFVIAMVRIGQLHLHFTTLVAAVATYAFTALILQLAVIVAYRLAPPKHREKTLAKVHSLLTRYANRALIGISLLLSGVLFVLAALQ